MELPCTLNWKTVTNAAKPTLTQDSTLRLNCSLLCSVVWGSCGKTFSNSYKNPKIVHWGARVLTFSNYEADAPQLLKKLNWDNVATRRQILKAEMVYKSLNGLSPDCKFIPRSDINNRYDLWNSANKLAVPLPRTNCYKNSFSYGGTAVPWKRLPSNVRRQPR